jgi:hypothetical protein
VPLVLTGWVGFQGKDTTFEMDHVFSAQSSQEEVFDKASDVIVSCIDGYNVGFAGGTLVALPHMPYYRCASLPTAKLGLARRLLWTAQTTTPVSTVVHCNICFRCVDRIH